MRFDSIHNLSLHTLDFLKCGFEGVTRRREGRGWAAARLLPALLARTSRPHLRSAGIRRLPRHRVRRPSRRTYASARSGPSQAGTCQVRPSSAGQGARRITLQHIALQRPALQRPVLEAAALVHAEARGAVLGDAHGAGVEDPRARASRRRLAHLDVRVAVDDRGALRQRGPRVHAVVVAGPVDVPVREEVVAASSRSTLWSAMQGKPSTIWSTSASQLPRTAITCGAMELSISMTRLGA